MEQHEEEEALELVAHCLCQAHRFTATVPRSSLPLRAIYCHCTSCRRVTGSMYSTFVPWPAAACAAVRRAASSSLRRYVFGPAITTLSCGVCGSTMFSAMTTAAPAVDGGGDDDGGGGSSSTSTSSAPSYGVQTGVLANVDVPGLLAITDHIFLGDTLDGGASPWLCDANPDGSRPRLWSGRRGEGQELSSPPSSPPPSRAEGGAAARDWPAVELGSASPASAGEQQEGEREGIPVRCHCGGVDLILRQPIADFVAWSRPALPWFVDPASNKSLGGFDACDSCRLASGSDVFHWTFVLLCHLEFPSSSSDAGSRALLPRFPASSVELRDAVAANSADRDPRLGTLAFYESSPGVQRYFCSRCSACVFYAADDRPEMVDLAVGLLDSKDGARAESLISWDFGGEMVWRQDTVGGWRAGFVESIEGAAERWRIKRGYPKNWRRIQKEARAYRKAE
ncbi:Mss4-like protein [Nemania diffusa]|nr:Mss4-like protein [Nemania diffusa]